MKQLSGGARRVYNQLKYYARGSGVAFPFHRLLASKLGFKPPTLRMYIAELRREGYVESRKRQHSSAEYRLIKPLCRHRSDHRSDHRSAGPYPLSELNLNKTSEGKLPRMPPQSETGLTRSETRDDFEKYIGAFLSAGKALNRGDVERACREWVSLDPHDRVLALRDAFRAIGEASAAKYIPLPANHLVSRAWTRRAVDGARPMTKGEQINAEARRMLEEELREEAERRAS